MRLRWKLILPAYGLFLFSVVSYHSYHADSVYKKHDARYFWWASIRLDSDPQGIHSAPVANPCAKNDQDCAVIKFDPEYISISPGRLERLLGLSALPAFYIGILVVTVFGKIGINEVLSFMIVMPVMICTWFYFLGWLIDCWRYKRPLKS